MAKHSIEIAVKSAREHMSAARRKIGDAAFGGGRSGFGRTDNRMTRALERNIIAQNQAAAAMKANVRAALDLRNHVRALGSTIRRHGILGTARGAAGAAFGGLKSTIPVLGFMLSGFMLLMNKAVQAGRAAMAAVEQQAQTAGLGGFQTRGIGTFGPAEVGRAERERRIAAGMPRQYASHRAYVESEHQRRLALRYARFAGADPSDTMRTYGLFQTQGGGFGQALARMRKEGMDVSQFRVVFQELVPALEEAVSGGISKSGLATDMAAQMAVMARYFPEGTGARAAAGAFRSFRQITTQVSRGQWSNMQGMRVMRAAAQLADRPGGIEELTAKDSKSLFEGMDPGAVRQRMQTNMVFRQAVLQQIAARRSPRVMMQYFRGLRKDLAGAMPAGMDERSQNILMARMAQGTGQGMGLNINQLAAGFAMSRKRPEKVTPEDMEKLRRELKMPETVSGVLQHRVMQEQQKLGVGATFIPIVKALDRASMELAKAGRDLGEGPIKTVTAAITGVSKQIPEVVKEFKEISKNIGEFVKRIGEMMPREDESTWQWIMRMKRNTGK